MAVVVLTGFEIADANTDNIGLNGTAAYSTNQARTGSRSIRCNPGTGATGFVSCGGLAVATYWRHFGLYIATLPSARRTIAGTKGAVTASVDLNPDGTLTYTDNNVDKGSSSALSTGQWYWIGYLIGTGSSVPALQVNGTTAVTTTLSGTESTNNYYGCTGVEASTGIDIYIDDVIIDTAVFLKPSKVALLVPISDNARGANWFKADGTTTTNLWQSVDNIPPAGVASASEAATPLASIRHTGGANNAYDANLTTYTSAGVNAGDTVIAMQSYMRNGEDIATGTKLLAYGLTSNPSETISASFAAGADGGAHAAELGLWVLGNAGSLNPIITSPSVTLGSSPVLRVSRPETASRVACVDFMGAYMAWTPVAAAANPPFTSRYPPFLAQ